ncbi:MFS transporter [Microbulbifer bruguierae]|uniref:MFS transporter n=1 Tax=Microbulbifer bruguierae TaxID=3029061 RepID=A0ABY8NFQ6_9GAMM|nr:MFS transporter [Microbulbifer bruguierae]WGL17771.1 MFS transporter [Microbulbifer bruguierae]
MNYSVFIPYLLARASLSLASTMLTVAIGWHLYQLTGDPYDLALVGLVQIIPMLMLFIVSGWAVDHFSRKRILILCSVLEGFILLGLAAFMHDGVYDKTSIFALLFLHGCVRAFFSPAQQAILPNIVSAQALSRAVAVTTTVWNAASTSGPFVAGLFLVWMDQDIYWLLGGLALLGALLYLTLPPIAHTRPLGRGIEQVLEGIHFIRRNPFVLGSISLDLFAVLFGSVMALLPIYAVDILKVGADALGVMRGMPALGAVVVGVIMTRLSLNHTGRSLFLALVIFAFSILLFAVSKNYWLSLVALFVYGASDMISVNIRSTLIQLATPDDLRGRVSAVNSIFIATSNQMGDYRAGAVASVIPAPVTVALGGVMALGVAISGYFIFPAIRKLKKMSELEHNPTQGK